MLPFPEDPFEQELLGTPRLPVDTLMPPDLMATNPEPAPPPLTEVPLELPETPVEVTDNPIELNEEDLNRMLMAVRSALDAARSARSEIDPKIRKLKQFIRLSGKRSVKTADGGEPYEGVPNVLTPLTAARVDAVRANVERTFFHTRPFFSAVPETPGAQRSARTWEAVMENSLRRSESHAEIKKAIHQAVELHVGVMAFEISADTGGIPAMRAVDIENFYIYPTATSSIRMSGATFEKLHVPNWKLREYGARGFFDAEAVERVTTQGGESSQTPAQEQIGIRDGTTTKEDWGLSTLWLTWIRWEGGLWRVYWSDTFNVIFRVERNFLPIDQPPYENLNSILEIDSFYSLPLAAMVQSYQDIIDSVYNSILAQAQFAIAPPIVSRDPMLLNDIASKGWAPGMTYQASLMLDDNNFRQIDTRTNVASQELLGITSNFAEAALPSVPNVPPGGRKTRYEVSVFAEASADRMAVLVSNISMGLRRLANTYWELLRYYYIDRIRPVYADVANIRRPSEVMLIGPEGVEIPMPDAVATEERNIGVAQYLMTQGIPPQIAFQIPLMLPPEMDKLIIHSAYRDDMHWQPSGGETLPERINRQQALQMVMASASFIPAARKDRGLWHLLQKMYENSGIADWIDILGPPPDTFDDIAIQQAIAIFGNTVNNAAMSRLFTGQGEE